MDQTDWDRLLPEGMQWVFGRRIKEGDSIVFANGKIDPAYGMIGHENIYQDSKACCPISQLFDGAQNTLAKEQDRRIAHVEAMIDTNGNEQIPLHSVEQRTCKITVLHPQSKQLTDHAKYCRLSKQTGGLCTLRNLVGTSINGCGYKFQYTESIKDDWTQCPRPEKQQPVELPKDPLEDLIKEYNKLLYDFSATYVIREKMLREFAEKVRVLNV